MPSDFKIHSLSQEVIQGLFNQTCNMRHESSNLCSESVRINRNHLAALAKQTQYPAVAPSYDLHYHAQRKWDFFSFLFRCDDDDAMGLQDSSTP